jgi:hypothetical protein
VHSPDTQVNCADRCLNYDAVEQSFDRICHRRLVTDSYKILRVRFITFYAKVISLRDFIFCSKLLRLSTNQLCAPPPLRDSSYNKACSFHTVPPTLTTHVPTS